MLMVAIADLPAALLSTSNVYLVLSFYFELQIIGLCRLFNAKLLAPVMPDSDYLPRTLYLVP